MRTSTDILMMAPMTGHVAIAAARTPLIVAVVATTIVTAIALSIVAVTHTPLIVAVIATTIVITAALTIAVVTHTALIVAVATTIVTAVAPVAPLVTHTALILSGMLIAHLAVLVTVRLSDGR